MLRTIVFRPNLIATCNASVTQELWPFIYRHCLINYLYRCNFYTLRPIFSKLSTNVEDHQIWTKLVCLSQGYSYERVNKTVFMIAFSFHNQTLWCDPHWNRLSETIPMSGNIIGLAFWKLSILDLICCPGLKLMLRTLFEALYLDNTIIKTINTDRFRQSSRRKNIIL